MSLASVLQTANSGMTAASMTMRVTGNNLANSRTAGFKASRLILTPQPPSTGSRGVAANGASGGNNPIQIGTGVHAAAVATDFSQGSIVLSANPLNVALQGEGLFIVAGPEGDQLFTRGGQFQLNAQGEIVTPGGQRLLGNGVDENFQIQEGALGPITITLGSTARTADGEAATLIGYSVNSDGRVIGNYSDGVGRNLGQIRIARFANPAGLVARGDNLLRASANSGLPVETSPGTAGSASIVGGAVELSNTDVGQSLIDLLTSTRQFRASAEVFQSADRLLDELTHLQRGR